MSEIQERVIILDFGSQYTQLIARRIRELNIFCEIYPYNKNLDELQGVKAIILSGSPYSVNDKERLDVDLKKVVSIAPTLGVCYGAQYMASYFGGAVARSEKREYGKATLHQSTEDPFWNEVTDYCQIWMSHGDSILNLPDGFETIGFTESIPVAGFRYTKGSYPMYGIQFHPEVTHSTEGLKILSNFLVDIAGCKQDWTPLSFIEHTVDDIRRMVGDEQVILGISGGVDSTVAALLIHKAIGNQLHALFINNGVLRKGEYEEVLHKYEDLGLNVHGIDASQEFLDNLDGVSEPEKKRKIIGKTFIDVFSREAKRLSGITWLAQGTIYPDVIESVSVNGPSATIKSHHNVGGLPKKLKLKLLEPLRMLFKDEVRRVGEEMELADKFVHRHPFPGPGLAIRILGEINQEKLRLCQEADYIYIEKLKSSGWYDKVWQAGAILLPIKSVGVMGDERTYEYTIALRAVNSKDGMTADWSRLPYDLLADISNEIINSVKGINRVVYDISTKPPATIEWE